MLKVGIESSLDIPIQLGIECLPGELHALVGPSGSGKTTALRAIAGLHINLIGRIECNGELWFNSEKIGKPDVCLPPSKRSCGFLFQQYALFPHLSALSNVAISLKRQKTSSKKCNTIAMQWLERMNIPELANRMPRQLSGGEQQRVALARALAYQPKILLLDEPFSAIDTPTRHELYKTLANLRQDLNIPIILVTHDLREADLLADRITVIDEGIGLQTSTSNQLFKKPRNARVAELVGISNLFHGTFNAGVLKWEGSNQIFKVIDKGRIPKDTLVAWVIPQEGLSVHATPTASSFSVIVKEISSLGQIAVIHFQLKDSAQRIVWEASSAEVKRLGIENESLMHLELDAEKIHIMPLRPINDPRKFHSSIHPIPSRLSNR